MISCLIIEDNAFDRKIIRRAAEACSLDLDLEEMTSIFEADQVLKKRRFDCILLDYCLPDVDGLSFARNFLASGAADTALIMLTGEGNEELAREALQLGILDYLTKRNLEPASLEAAVSNALEKIKLQRERQAALDELKRSNQALSRFAAVVAHDLKAPIRQMRTFSGFLSEDYKDALDDEGKKLLDTIERSADRAFKLIDGVLAYSRLEKEGEQQATLQLRSAVDDAVANLAALIEETEASVEIDDLPTVVGVECQLMQLFQNLIGNALKFRHPARPPVIRIWSRALQDGIVEVSVEDNGIGVGSEDRQRIFNMLERLHSQDRYEGSGIGLATCKRIVENHGGAIWCSSDETPGTIFRFTLDWHDATSAGNKLALGANRRMPAT